MGKLSVFIIFVFTLLFLVPSAFAAAAAPLIDCDKLDVPFVALCKMSTTSVPDLIGAALTFIFVIAVVVAIFFLLLGALKWIYSGGDKAAVEGARNTITAAVIGLVILFLVFLVFTVVLGFFGVKIEEIVLPSVIKP